MAAGQDDAAVIDLRFGGGGMKSGIGCAFDQSSTAGGTPIGLSFFGQDGVAVDAVAFHRS